MDSTKNKNGVAQRGIDRARNCVCVPMEAVSESYILYDLTVMTVLTYPRPRGLVENLVFRVLA